MTPKETIRLFGVFLHFHISPNFSKGTLSPMPSEDIMLVFKSAALTELILVILEFGGFIHLRWLPLGGGQIQQIGIVFATAYVIAELIELTGNA
jgi:hypothetical protein